ncbi:MAG: hypothetical protein AMJ69_10040 [Gammaproteobacteria bacterium SG8_47]|nr:MAG: hypothetical protein AMJ69_10040 [Gammaproteobacteria bacterium SG8_47]
MASARPRARQSRGRKRISPARLGHHARSATCQGGTQRLVQRPHTWFARTSRGVSESAVK